MKKIISMLVAVVTIFILVGCNRNPTLNEIQGEEIFNKEGSYFVYFYKNDCEDCERIKPYIQTYIKVVAEEEKYENKSTIYSVNLDGEGNQLISRNYNSSQPNLSDPQYFKVSNVEEWDELYIPSAPALISIREDSSGRRFARFEAVDYDGIYERIESNLED